jgi:hypothetical protein
MLCVVVGCARHHLNDHVRRVCWEHHCLQAAVPSKVSIVLGAQQLPPLKMQWLESMLHENSKQHLAQKCSQHCHRLHQLSRQAMCWPHWLKLDARTASAVDTLAETGVSGESVGTERGAASTPCGCCRHPSRTPPSRPPSTPIQYSGTESSARTSSLWP